MERIIEIKNLSKSFGKICAVDNISFNVRRGELFAFLGVNGAGKSTTINVICSVLGKDTGSVIIDGESIDEKRENIKSKIGVVFQNSVLDKSLSVYENLKSRASLYGIYEKEFENKLSYLCSILQFEDILTRTVGKLSGGQRRRIDIARALISNPKILILDEPTTGLDPQTRILLWDVIEKMRKENSMTVFLTTHYMEEAANADHVVILDNGKISAEGTPLELKNRYASDFITLYTSDENAIRLLSKKYSKIKDGFKIEVKNTKEATELILQNPDLFVDYEITKGRMDDVFLAVTGKKLSGGEK